ncbi:inositol 1,4,5-triphosphate receptor associated 1 isoform X3 [Parasteatoda tepidariorum]|uniref:inositol 1,4,5-triphosphate receptor associated 1 isoform X3 n=1 Tax=Parasteatoda tepidariorum TaxID=114398 RepID=UPI001C7292D8|nr:inositol 1,4,5-triphosphate receptor associated 1 isoform X2 [Parasteatoda tepidariorum]
MRLPKVKTKEMDENKHYFSFNESRPPMSLEMKRGLLKRSRALTMDIGERIIQYRTTLKSLPEFESGCIVEEDDNEQAFPSLPDRLLKAIGLYRSHVDNNKNLNEPDIEEKFARLSLAFKTDKFTLGKRLDLQLRQRDIAEKNIDSELKALRESLNALNQLCTESDMRDLITKTQQHVDIVQQATMRMSSRAETYGAIQQEQRMNCAFETMLNYVEHLKLLYDKEHLELEEYRRLLAEHNLLPADEKSLLEDDAKRVLPPRSQSLSCTPRPEMLRRGSLGTFIRPPADNDKFVNRENSQINLASWTLNTVRQKLESKTRLLSSVCLLNNNFESSSSMFGKPPHPGSVSPKSRRSSLPVGPLAAHHQSSSHHQAKTLSTTNEKQETKTERKESFAKASRLSRTESEESTISKEGSECPEKSEDVSEENSAKDSSDVSFIESSLSLPPDNKSSELPLQESACDKDIIDSVCLLPEIIVPVKSKSVFLLHMIQKAVNSRVWKMDSATLLLHARYTLSAILATAAMFTLVMTFVPT